MTPVLKLKSEQQSFFSECDIDYRYLKRFLENKEWERANEETINLLLQASGRESFGALDGGKKSIGTLGDRDVLDIPCKDLHTIDNLWINYSGGRWEHVTLFGRKITLV